jgi:hypothetical protein
VSTPTQLGDGWFKSSRSNGNSGNCLACKYSETVGVMDTKHPEGPKLTVSRPVWRSFLAAAGAGEFDR